MAFVEIMRLLVYGAFQKMVYDLKYHFWKSHLLNTMHIY